MVPLDTIMTLVTVVPVETITRKRFVKMQEILYQLQVQNQSLCYVLAELQSVLVAEVVTETAVTDVHLMQLDLDFLTSVQSVDTVGQHLGMFNLTVITATLVLCSVIEVTTTQVGQ